jgi:hypothetical protein
VARPAAAGHPGVAGLAAAGLAAAELDAPPAPRRRGGNKKARDKKADSKLPGRTTDRSLADPKPASAGRGQQKAVASSGALASPPATRATPGSARPSAAAANSAVAATAVQPRLVRAAPAGGTSTPARARRAGKKRRRALKRSLAVGAGLAVVAGGVVGYEKTRPTGPVHSVTAPSRLLNYAQVPALAKGMKADALRAQIVKAGKGEASNVVDGVYEGRTGAAAKSGPVIILFVGGHLSGSASSFINSFTGMLPGAFVTSAGSMAGQAACVPSYSGHLAECVWADNDTFGFIASPALSASSLSAQLRQIRPLVEHTVK